MKKLLFILVLFLSLIFGCKEDAVTEPDTQSPIPPIVIQTIISGTVSESSGLTAIPSKDISVTLYYSNDSLKTITDGEGKFIFKIEGVEVDTFTIVAKSDGYGPEDFYYTDIDSTEKQNLILTIKETYKTISGILTEKDEAGVHSSVDTEVTLKSNYINQSTVTDNSGKFTFKITTNDFDDNLFNSFTLHISKSEFTVIDSFFLKGKNSISDILLQLINVNNYFPIKVGNRWEYLVFVWDCGSDYYSNKFEGIEIWEISTVESDGKSFTLAKYFTGTMKRIFQLNDVLETTYFENEKSSYNLQYNNGVIEAAEEGGAVPSSLKRINFIHPYYESDIFSEEYVEGDETTSYTLEIGVGINEYEYYDNRGWANEFTREKLTLLTFTEGG